VIGQLFFVLGLGAAAGGVLTLCRAWKRPAQGRAQGGRILAGWIAAGASLVLLAAAMGFDRGPAAGICVVGAIAYGLIALGVDVRKPKKAAREPAPGPEPLDPLPRPMRLARATLRCLAAVVLAASASLALAAAWSLHGLGTAPDRLVTAAYAMPLVWGAAMTWSLSDERLSRPVAGLAILTAAGASLAWLPGAGA
jgi:hypothetical protein